MRKYIFFLFLISVPFLSAQSLLDKPEIYIGVSAGGTASMISFTPAVQQNFLYGINTGIAFRFIAEKNVGVQAELNYSQRGWREKSGMYARELNYLELPFLTHIYIGNKTQFVINLGPKISYLLSEKTLFNNTSDNETQHLTMVQNRFDYGLCAGFGVQLHFKKNVIVIDTRGNFGLSDVFSNNKRDYFDASNNINVSLNMAYYFKVK